MGTINNCRNSCNKDVRLDTTTFKFFSLTLVFIFFFSMGVFAQTISGSVTGSDNKPVEGATITVKETKISTVVNKDGRFSISANKGNTLLISSVNFETLSFIVGDQTSVDIKLDLKSGTLGDVVVIGYGSQRKRDITGAVSTIDVSKVKDVPVTNISRLLVGQAPGVTVRQQNGSPGNEFQVLIRGMGSLGAGSEPLYVIDGFPIGTSIGQNLNPADIEAITILKDAVSTAIYGARGSNGVVLITTKSAKAGKLNLNFSANYGIQNIPDSRKVKVLNGVDFAQFKKDLFMDKIRYFENREPLESEVPLDYRFPEQTEHSTNWYDEILNNNARFQNYNLTLSQGTGNIRTLVSFGFTNQEGAVINTKYDNYSLRANIGGKINNFIEMGLNINGSYSMQKLAPNSNGWTGILSSSLLMDPRKPVYNDDGSFNSYITGPDMFGWGNPVQILTESKNNLNTSDFLSSAFLEFSLLKGLKFKSVVNVKLNSQAYKQFTPSTVSGVNAPAPRNASLSEFTLNTTNYSTDQLLTYSSAFGDHSVNVMAGFNAQEENSKNLSGSGNTFSSDVTPYFGAATIRDVNSSEYGWSTLAYFGRLNYSFRGKYLFSGTFRREGNSRFGASTKYGNFPALSAGWRIFDEAFMPQVSWLNDLKLRASWGITGNSNIGNYPSLAYMNSSGYILGNSYVNGSIVSAFANPNLKWELSKQTDFGIDLSAFNNKLTFSADYYRKITTDMLLPIQIPAISGFTTTFTNIGKVQNTGLEFLVGYKTRFKKVDFFGNFNISFNRNKVLALRNADDEIRVGDFYDGYNVSRVGRPIGMLHGFRVVKVFNNQDEINKAPTQDGAIPGVNQYFDANGDGEISYDTEDMVEIGNPLPKFNWGLTFGGSYRNFDISVLLSGAQGYDIYRRIETSTMNMDGIFNVLEESKDRWRSEQNPGNGKFTTTNTWKWERESSSRYVYNGSHMWLKNATIGYSISQIRSKVFSLRLFLSGDNLLLFTNYPGNNPEINNRGGTNPSWDDEAYPVARTLTLGLNLTF